MSDEGQTGIQGRLDELEAKVKALETLTLPLRDFALTNQVNRLEQAVTALTERLDAMEQRINTLFGDGGVAAFVEDRIKIALGKVGQ